MSGLLILLVLLPWSVYRQMRAHEVTPQGLIRLPVIFAAIGVLGFGLHGIDAGRHAAAYVALSVVLSIGFGVWRAVEMRVWRDADGTYCSQGTRRTLALWGGLILTKVAIDVVRGMTGGDASPQPGDIFLFLALSFVAQNVVIARRTLWDPRSAARSSIPTVMPDEGPGRA